jgi:hypothetical protein
VSTRGIDKMAGTSPPRYDQRGTYIPHGKYHPTHVFVHSKAKCNEITESGYIMVYKDEANVSFSRMGCGFVSHNGNSLYIQFKACVKRKEGFLLQLTVKSDKAITSPVIIPPRNGVADSTFQYTLTHYTVTENSHVLWLPVDGEDNTYTSVADKPDRVTLVVAQAESDPCPKFYTAADRTKANANTVTGLSTDSYDQWSGKIYKNVDAYSATGNKFFGATSSYVTEKSSKLLGDTDHKKVLSEFKRLKALIVDIFQSTSHRIAHRVCLAMWLHIFDSPLLLFAVGELTTDEDHSFFDTTAGPEKADVNPIEYARKCTFGCLLQFPGLLKYTPKAPSDIATSTREPTKLEYVFMKDLSGNGAGSTVYSRNPSCSNDVNSHASTAQAGPVHSNAGAAPKDNNASEGPAIDEISRLIGEFSGDGDNSSKIAAVKRALKLAIVTYETNGNRTHADANRSIRNLLSNHRRKLRRAKPESAPCPASAMNTAPVSHNPAPSRRNKTRATKAPATKMSTNDILKKYLGSVTLNSTWHESDSAAKYTEELIDLLMSLLRLNMEMSNFIYTSQFDTDRKSFSGSVVDKSTLFYTKSFMDIANPEFVLANIKSHGGSHASKLTEMIVHGLILDIDYVLHCINSGQVDQAAGLINESLKKVSVKHISTRVNFFPALSATIKKFTGNNKGTQDILRLRMTSLDPPTTSNTGVDGGHNTTGTA